MADASVMRRLWRVMISGARRRFAEGDGAGGRRAGAFAVPHRTEKLDQGRLVTGVGGRHRGQRPDRRKAAIRHAGLWLAVGGERRRRERLGKRLVWIVDPIDGTRGYLAGREDWCVSVALVEDARPLLAAVFAPASDEFFFAERGRGSLLNGLPVHAASGTELDFSRMAGPKPLVERLNRSAAEITLHPRIGSLALRLCRVAQGQARCGLCGRSKPRLGPCRGQFDRAGSEW